MIHFRRASALVLLSTFAFAPVALAAVADHQQCYKIKDETAKALYTADLVPTDPAFPTVAGCEVKVPASMLCIDVEKTNVTPTPPGAAEGLPAQKSLCYKVKCPKLDPAVTVSETDQFGVHSVTAKQTSWLCVPIPAPVTTTTLPGSCNTDLDCDPLPGAQQVCSSGTCVFGFCDAGFANCNMTTADGCEVSTFTDPDNCSGCGNVCALPNATEGCSAGSCVVSACDSGYSDCNLSPMDGCEAATASDPNNCGACNTVCSLPNATEGCMAGSCFVALCNAGYNDCNNNPVDGCEVSVQGDPNNCGGCGLTCPVMTPNCMAGNCVP